MKAKVVCMAILNLNGMIEYVAEHTMSTDLPAENLGELVADCVQGMWAKGYDPMSYKLVMEFK